MISGWLFLVVGLVLLLHLVGVFDFGRSTADVGVTLLFLLAGIGHLAKCSCKDCMAMCDSKKMK